MTLGKMEKRYMREGSSGWEETETASDFLDPIDDTDDLALISDEDSERAGLCDIMRRLALYTIPGERCRNGAARRFRAGYVRWVALVWLTNRDLLEHKTQAEVAAILGISSQAFSKHVNQLAARGVAYGSTKGPKS